MFNKELISTKKNLLAFSAGVDSSALFFILIDLNIQFDIAIVNYNLREQSKDEVQYALDLSKKYNKNIYIKTYKDSNFSEKKARDFRYEFFDKVLLNNNYEALITAHQLNDKLEWFFMQLSKGAGLVELIGLNQKDRRKDYIIYKPLLEISKDELEDFLKINNHKYYIDETNKQNLYKRNYFRNEFTNKFISEFKNGVKNSFKYLQNDIGSLNLLKKTIQIDNLYIAKFNTNDENILIKYIDQKLKELNIIISSATRQEILNQKEIIISNRIAISIIKNIVYISPNYTIIMDKKFKEKCRINNIPKNIRSYIFKINNNKFNKIIDFLK
jgi:tRNA(Ile)-lysidine synthase